jgi:hypothetical protein
MYDSPSPTHNLLLTLVALSALARKYFRESTGATV